MYTDNFSFSLIKVRREDFSIDEWKAKIQKQLEQLGYPVTMEKFLSDRPFERFHPEQQTGNYIIVMNLIPSSDEDLTTKTK
jgi:hypothetical protein